MQKLLLENRKVEVTRRLQNARMKWSCNWTGIAGEPKIKKIPKRPYPNSNSIVKNRSTRIGRNCKGDQPYDDNNESLVDKKITMPRK